MFEFNVHHIVVFVSCFKLLTVCFVTLVHKLAIHISLRFQSKTAISEGDKEDIFIVLVLIKFDSEI
jgi:hypothetical protein